jgi:hypothetical protein
MVKVAACTRTFGKQNGMPCQINIAQHSSPWSAGNATRIHDGHLTRTTPRLGALGQEAIEPCVYRESTPPDKRRTVASAQANSAEAPLDSSRSLLRGSSRARLSVLLKCRLEQSLGILIRGAAFAISSFILPSCSALRLVSIRTHVRPFRPGCIDWTPTRHLFSPHLFH